MSSWPVFDVAEICQESSERAGIEFRSGYALRSARRSLELLSIEWSSRGLNLWTIDGPTPITLVPGIYQYFLPEDTVDIIEHNLRTFNPAQATTYTDLPLVRMTVAEYSAIPNKLAQGRPTIIHIRRQIKPYFLLWMVPPVTPVMQLVLWRLRRMNSLGPGGTGTPEIPWRFIPAMIAGLAYYMSLKSKDPNAIERINLLKGAYEEQFQLASDEDRDRASINWVPGGYERI
jgi:hypothetical protein